MEPLIVCPVRGCAPYLLGNSVDGLLEVFVRHLFDRVLDASRVFDPVREQGQMFPDPRPEIGEGGMATVYVAEDP